jgi:cytochrome oxidase Cu insertion factor (SCO1/SenC/PrrC family)
MLLLVCGSAYAQQPQGIAKLGGDFRLTDHHGKPFELQQMRGKVVLLFFGYTWCPTVCPESLTQMAQVLRELEDKADDIGVLFISVDPERDSVEKLAQYVPYFNSRVIGLTGSLTEIEQVTKAYRASYRLQKKSPDDDNYTIDHTADIYVLDGNGKVASIVPFGMPAQHITHVVRQMLSASATAATADIGTAASEPVSPSASPAIKPGPQTVTVTQQAAAPALKHRALSAFNGTLQPPLQSFRPTDLQGKAYDLSAYAGKPVLINFWASWCPPCRAELPALNRAAGVLQADDIVTLAVNVGDSKAAVLRFLDEYPIDFPVLLDEAGESMAQWAIKGMPTTVLLDSRGGIAFHVAGERVWDDEQILTQIRQLAGQQR